ncbi:MAG TPA: ABC transporter ATP-binding protein [Thermoplasmata archaeon]|nr:ABC transporter ATP-binding protein [Thermoplasmata archaeon]
MGDVILEVRDLRVYYSTKRGPVHAVDGVSFDLHAGETLGVVGETGCGKSTLGKSILGLLPPRTQVTGRLALRGRDLVGISEAELRRLRGEELALIFQDPMTRLDPLMTIREHFVETIRAHDRTVSADEAAERAADVLRSMGISDNRLNHYPHEFSGGMRQRIMIALALVLNPKLLVADEPTTALDVIVEAQILDILRDLRRAYSMSLLLITHNLGIVAEVCDRVAVMYAGQFVEVGPVETIFRRPIHPYTQGLLASTISMATKELRSIDGLPPSLLTPPSGCRFHPRCPYAQDICTREEPAIVEYRPGQPAACHFGKDFV